MTGFLEIVCSGIRQNSGAAHTRPSERTRRKSADFRYADFRYADFRYADFRHADFRHADFRHADLRYFGVKWTIVLLGLACSAAGGEPARPSDSPLVFRRVFVPQEAIGRQEAFPVEDEAYLPVKREEFEQLLSGLQGQYLAPEASLGPRVSAGTYTASLEGENVLRGTAQLAVVHRADTPGAVVLEPCNLVIDQPWWTPQGTGAPDANAAPAGRATKIGCEDSGRLVTLVNGAGVLRFDWTLRGTKEPTGEVAFDLQLPASSVNQLRLTLPKGLKPLVDTGVVTPPAAGGGDQSTEDWLLQVRGDAPARLLLVPASGWQVAAPLGLLRQTATHSISPDADEVTIVLKLDLYGQPLGRVALAVDERLKLVQATYGKLPLSWLEAAGPQRQITLQFAEPILGPDHEIVLQALAPVTLGQKWKLPRVSATELLWQEGTTTLEIPDSLVLDAVHTTDGVQTKSSPLAAPRRGEAIEIRDYHTGTSTDVVLRSREANVVASTGTSVKLGLVTANLTYVAELQVAPGPLFLVELETSPGWIVDLVETQPAELLEDWNLQRRGNQSRLLQVRLRGDAGESLVRLLVHAHRRGLDRDARLSGKDLRLGTLRRVRTVRSLMALTADAKNQIRLFGDAELTRLAPDALTDRERGLLQTASGSVVFVDGAAADGLQVSLGSEQPQYAAEIRIDSTYAAQHVRQSFAIRCVPQRSKVDRVLVQFSEELGPSLHWSVRGEPELMVSTRRLDPPSSGVRRGPQGGTWEIVLPQPQEKAFELLATWTGEFADASSVSFVAVPRAATQVGYLTIRTSEAMPLKIEQKNLKAIPPEVAPDGMFTTTLGSFRYEPAQETACRVAQAATALQTTPAWVWLCRLDSRFSPDGQGLHTATYRIENRGRPQVTVTSPPGVDLLEIRVNGKPLALPAETAARSRAVAPLPQDIRFPTLSVRYVTHHGRLKAFSAASVPWPRLDLPTFERQWLVRVPATYQIASTDRDIPSPAGRGSAWQRRMFGPLVRPLTQPRFQPLSWNAWLSLPGLTHPTDADLPLREGVSLLRGLAEELSHGRRAGLDAGDISWGALLAGAQQRGQKARPAATVPILVDQAALAERGLDARTTIDVQDALLSTPGTEAADPEASARRGAELLERAALALVAHQDWLLLTTPDALAAGASPSEPGPYRCLTFASPGSRLERLVASTSELRITTLDAWMLQPALPQRCWATESADDQVGMPNDGWQVALVPLTDGSAGRPWADVHRSSSEAWEAPGPYATSVVICRTDVVIALGWATLLISLGLAAWLTRRRVVWAVPLIGLAGVVALLGPEIFAPILTGCFLGTLAGALLSFVRPLGFVGPWKSPSRGSSTFSLVNVPSSTAALMLVLALVSAAISRGAESAPAVPTPAVPAPKTPQSEAPKIYRVLYPIDDARQPVGPYVFVPRDFYDLLTREASRQGESTRHWIIDDASYRVLFESDVAAGQLVAKEIVAEYRLQTYRPQTRVVLPIGQEQAYLVPNRARLDGEPASVSWEPDGSGLAVEVPEIAEAALQLAFRPRVESSPDTAHLELRIPPVPNARVHLQLPADAPPVDCPTALGGAVLENPGGERVVQLGPTNRLRLQWSIGPDQNAQPSELEVDQLAWLKVRPGSVVLDAKWKVSCAAGRIRQSELRADVRLRLLPPPSDQPVEAVHERDGPPRTIRFVLKPPYQQQVTLHAQFVLANASGIGPLRVPRLEAVAQRTQRRWLAVSVDPSLQHDPPAEAGPADPAAFVAAWGETAEAPQFVLAIPDGEPAASLAVRPQKPKLNAAQRTEVVCGLERAEIQFQADLDVADGSVFQYELSVPAAVSVDSVAVLENGDEQVARWSRNAGERVVARLPRPITGQHRLLLRASLPWSAGPKQRIPRIALANGEPVSEQFFIYRRPQVQVRLAEQPELVALPEGSLGQHRNGWGRCVAAWTAAPGKPATALQLEVTPNRPKTRGVLLMALRRNQDLWRADAEYEVHIESGVVDTLRLDLPAEWNGPFEVQGDAEQELVELPGQDRRYLVIRPRQALSQSCRLHIRGTVSVPPGERVRVPDVGPLDVDQAERYVVAPRKLGPQTIAWETSGLQETSLPEGWGGFDPALYVSYAVTQPHFHAVIKDVEPEAGTPLVTLADVFLDCQADGPVWGVATFDLQPAGRATCELELPKDYRLVHVSLGSLPALLESRGEGRWQVTLGSPQLAQQLQLVFRGTLPLPSRSAGSRSVLHAPKLSNLPVATTLWTIQTPAGRRAEVAPAESRIDPWGQELVRFQQRAELIESTSTVLTEIDPNVTARWYRIWLRRLALARSKAAQWGLKRLAPAAERSPAQAAVDERYKAIIAKLGPAETVSPTEPATPQVSEPADVWQIALSKPETTVHRLRRTEPGAVEIWWQPAADADLQGRLAAVAALFGLSLTAFLVIPFPGFARWRSQFLPFTGAVLGFVWWLWLTPSAAGLLLVLFSLLAWSASRLGRFRGRRT